MKKIKEFLLAHRYGVLHIAIAALMAIAVSAVGMRIWWRLYMRGQAREAAPAAIREQNDAYHYIRPLLFCGSGDNREFQELRPLKGIVQRVIDRDAPASGAQNISVYFRDLDHGKWFGINEQEKYSPASLLKVPTLLAFLRMAEKNPEILSLRVRYTGGADENLAEYFRPSQGVERGKSYSVDQLLQYMIVTSDNNARRLLHDTIDPRVLAEVYTDLGLSLPKSVDEVDFMSIKQYSYFFRTLYNATYLNRDLSEKALQMLAASDFAHGLRTGVPINVPMAHKFGERTIFSPDGTRILARELHECGIVYHPAAPYLLCVMTRGKQMNGLARMIANISAAVYAEADKSN